MTTGDSVYAAIYHVWEVELNIEWLNALFNLSDKRQSCAVVLQESSKNKFAGKCEKTLQR